MRTDIRSINEGDGLFCTLHIFLILSAELSDQHPLFELDPVEEEWNNKKHDQEAKPTGEQQRNTQIDQDEPKVRGVSYPVIDAVLDQGVALSYTKAIGEVPSQSGDGHPSHYLKGSSS